jgi:hypothetical protein
MVPVIYMFFKHKFVCGSSLPTKHVCLQFQQYTGSRENHTPNMSPYILLTVISPKQRSDVGVVTRISASNSRTPKWHGMRVCPYSRMIYFQMLELLVGMV